MAKQMTVWKEFTFDASHRLMEYDGACSNLHGHTWKVQVGFRGKLVDNGHERGMIIDFNNIKKLISMVMRRLDHAVILELADENTIKMLQDSGNWVYVMEERPTVENMATLIMKMIGADAIRMWETPKSYVEIV